MAIVAAGRKRRMTGIALYCLTLLFVAWSVLPFIWTLTTSFKNIDEIYQTPPTIVPENVTVGNYVEIFEKLQFFRYFLNSAIVTIATIVITVILSILASYAFSRFTFPLRSILLMGILIPRIIPSVTRIIPLYQIFQKLNLLDTYASLIAPYIADALPIGVWILIGFFDSLPRELEEAAMIDGCSRLGALRRVIVPLIAPGVVSVALFTFLRAWNEFIVALTFIGRNAMMTLPVAHYRVFEFFGLRHWGAINAFTVLVVIPIITFFLIFERHLVKSMVAGAVKG
jgi:multiple sugar transport system permease protein